MATWVELGNKQYADPICLNLYFLNTTTANYYFIHHKKWKKV